MRTVIRRQLNRDSGQIVDQVLATGEAVEVTTQGRDSVMIIRKPMSNYERMKAQGLITPGTGRFGDGPQVSSDQSVKEILDDIRGER